MRNYAILLSISFLLNACIHSGKHNISKAPHPQGTGSGCDACTDAGCTTAPVLCYSPNPVTTVYSEFGNNYAYFTLTNKTSLYKCQVQLDHPNTYLTPNLPFAFTLFPNESIEVKTLINSSWDGTKCTGNPCTFDSLKFQAIWDAYDVGMGPDEDHVIFQWTKPHATTSCWIIDNAGVNDNMYIASIGTYPNPDASTPVATTYHYNQVYEITNNNNFDFWIQVNNPPDGSGMKPGCLTNDLIFDGSGNWMHVAANSSIPFGGIIAMNFSPSAVGAGKSAACLSGTAATAIIYSTHSYLDPTGRKWISLKVALQ